MKKILALTLTGLIAVIGSGATVAASAVTEDKPLVQAAETAVSENLYLVPGVYTADGVKKENSISAGAQKLTGEQCDEIFTENAYLCTLSVGDTLPTPSSERKDKDGNDYSFNGWWAIVDATVTYFDKVPKITETTFLYADWRADLSQRMDPIIPKPGVVVEPNHYLLINAGTENEQKVKLGHKGTEMSNAVDLGYGYATELYVMQLSLKAGDTIQIYTTGLIKDKEEPVMAPVMGSNNKATVYLDFNAEKNNYTSDYLTATDGDKWDDPSITVKDGVDEKFNVYIKFFDGGSLMWIYLEIPA